MAEHLAETEARDSYNEWNNDELAKAAKEGDREARNTLFFRCRTPIERLSRSATRSLKRNESSLIDAEDIEQQTFLIFCELIEEWEPTRAPFMAYLVSMMPWRILHYVRGTLRYRSKVRVEAVPKVNTLAKPALTIEDDPQRVVEAMEWAERAAPLREPWRRSLELRFYGALSSKEIAQISGRSTRSVNRYLRAAITSMRAALAEEWESCA